MDPKRLSNFTADSFGPLNLISTADEFTCRMWARELIDDYRRRLIGHCVAARGVVDESTPALKRALDTANAFITRLNLRFGAIREIQSYAQVCELHRMLENDRDKFCTAINELDKNAGVLYYDIRPLSALGNDNLPFSAVSFYLRSALLQLRMVTEQGDRLKALSRLDANAATAHALACEFRTDLVETTLMLKETATSGQFGAVCQALIKLTDTYHQRIQELAAQESGGDGHS